MATLQLAQVPVAKTGMLIRKPAAAGLKALLEHGIELNLVRDRFPNGPKQSYPDE